MPVVISPLTVLRQLPVPALPQDITDVIFTSETAVAAGQRAGLPTDLPAWCVGIRTAEAARRAGHDVRLGPGDGVELVELITKSHPNGRYLHIRGRDAAIEVAAILSDRGIRCTGIVAYEQQPVTPSVEALALLAGEAPVVLPLFSPRAADAVMELAHRAPLWVAAMSPAVALASEGLGPERLVVARTPDAEAMLDAIGSLIATVEET